MTRPPIHVTHDDFHRLTMLIEQQPPARREQLTDLEDELNRAVLVDADHVPTDVVTMNSRIEFVEIGTGRRREVTLVYPQAADIEVGRLSILTPVGSALLGLAVGQSIDWRMPDGVVRELRIERVA